MLDLSVPAGVSPTGTHHNGVVSSVPPIHFAQSDGARIAYQVFGSGSAPVLAVPPLAQNIEVAWERPEIRRMLERLGSFCRYVHFDKRGTGSSDRRIRVPVADERVEDVRAVMDDAGFDSAHLLGASEGAPTALLFAATYPRRVLSVTLQGTGASEYPPGFSEADRAGRRKLHERFVALWGTPESPMARDLAPSLAGDAGFASWHQRYERLSADQDSLRELLELTFDNDVREVVGSIRAPLLVLHRIDDRVVPIARSRELLELNPRARLIELDGSDHVFYAGDTEEWLRAFEHFVTAAVRPRPVSGLRANRATIELMGGFAVKIGRDEVPSSAWGSRKARTLCQRLAVAQGRPVRREELIDILWPDGTDPVRLSARLSVQLSSVRRILNGGVIADRSTVRLDTETVEVDLISFMEAADDEQVVRSYGGSVLAEEPDARWMAGVRVDAIGRFLRSAERFGHLLLDRGDPIGAGEVARRMIDTDGWDPRGHALLIASLLLAGEERQARLAHQEWERLSSELGVPVGDLDSFRKDS